MIKQDKEKIYNYFMDLMRLYNTDYAIELFTSYISLIAITDKKISDDFLTSNLINFNKLARLNEKEKLNYKLNKHP